MIRVMTRFMKHLLMFAPLAILFVGIGVVSYDLKNPLSENRDTCTVLATGSDVEPYKRKDNALYDHGATSRYDIGFACQHLGIVTINDQETLESGFVEAGNDATITHKTFRVWPETWRISVENSLNLEEPGRL